MPRKKEIDLTEYIPEQYGLKPRYPLRPIEWELWCFKRGHTQEAGGLGRYGHLRRAISLMWPKTSWNPWLETALQSLCDYNFVCWTGCGASGKTHAAALFSMMYWLADPIHTSVILTSTTAKMIRKRAWATIQTLMRESNGFPGHMVDSKTTLQAVRGDDKHSISAIAVKEGNTQAAVANIQGIRSPRTFVVIDEATDTPEAAFEACTNLQKGTNEFKLLVIGNPASKFDPHGRFATPKEGWTSVSVEDEEWETSLGGICIRFDGCKSPNIKAGKRLYPYLIDEEQVKRAERNEGENSPTFWKYTRGFWAPDGMVKTVLSESICDKFDLRKPVVFERDARKIAGFDPAFGGDRAVLKFARLGYMADNRQAINFDETVEIRPSAMSKEPVHFQIARRCIEECKKRGVEAEDLAVDGTGEGAATCDIITAEWGSPTRVGFGGAPTDRAVSESDSRRCSEVYKNRVTELWFSSRHWAMEGRLGGMDDDTLKELCARMFEDKAKIVVERKEDMKKRTGKSPDLADAAVLVIEKANQVTKSKASAPRIARWEDMLRKSNQVYDELYAEAA